MIPCFRLAALVVMLAGLVQTVGAQGGDDYIVLFQPGTTGADRAGSAQRAGAALRSNYSIVAAAAVRVPNANALQALQRDPSVIQVIPDRRITAFQQADVAATAKPGGGGTGGQVVPEGVKRVGPMTLSSDGAGVGVAIVDTGIDFTHRDLSIAPSSFTAFGTSCQDNNGHGTHVAGTVAALNNLVDVVGVAPQAKPYCVKVLDSTGNGSDSTVMDGLNWIGVNHNLVNPPIRVVNMSLGREGSLDDNPALRGAVAALYNAGIVVVVSAGNNQNLDVRNNVPATYPEVLAVASTTAKAGTNKCRFLSGSIQADTASYFTTDGAFAGGIGVTVSGPGEDQENVSAGCLISGVGILSTRNGGGTTRLSGTSMAAPHVSGVVARIIQSGLSGVENIRGLIRSTADRIGTAPLNSPTSSYTFDGDREGVVKAP